MHEDLAGLSDRELERIAYGRVDDVDSRARAAAAGDELARRATAEASAAAERELELHRMAEAAEPSEADRADAAVSSPELAHRRRMRMVGLAGVLAAALALPVVGWALTAPDPDPLAIFQGQQNPTADALVAELIGPDALSAITVGPELVPVGDDIVAIAFRASTVPDGRSTAWDAYCLLTARDPEVDAEEGDTGDTETGSVGPGTADSGGADWVLSGNCVTPDRFEAQGIIAARRVLAEVDEAPFDAVVWGPDGSPRIARNLSDDAMVWSGSVTDALAFSGLQPRDAFPSAPEVDDLDRLVSGPAVIGSAGGQDGRALTVSSSLQQSSVEGVQGTEPVYCLRVTVEGEEAREATDTCEALPLVERNGLSTTARAADQMWLVEVGPDGSLRLDRF